MQFDQLRRREFITLLGGAAAAWPLAAIAQRSPEVRRVGVLANEPWPPLEGLRDGMRALGYIDERGLHFEYRFAEGRAERYPALAAELVRLPADAIVAWGTPASLAAKQATGTVPIVMISGDPIAVGLVPGLAHPGANVIVQDLIRVGHGLAPSKRIERDNSRRDHGCLESISTNKMRHGSLP